MEKAELMQEKITEQRKLPNDIKDKLNNITFVNLLISIALMVYLLAINLVYLNEDIQFFITSVRIFAIVLAMIDITLFEIAYRKDSGALWIHSIELLFCSVLILAIPYVYVYANAVFRNILMLSPVFFSIYYVGKTIIIHLFETKKYQNNLSDVKEIMKDDVEGYLDDVEDSEEDDKETTIESDTETDNINVVENVNNIEKQKKEEKKALKEAKKAKKKGE